MLASQGKFEQDLDIWQQININHGNSVSHNAQVVKTAVTNLSADILLEGSLGQNET